LDLEEEHKEVFQYKELNCNTALLPSYLQDEEGIMPYPNQHLFYDYSLYHIY
jgi:hypothetical protein